MNNILFCGENINAVLDWEMFSVGDPRLDFFISLSYISDNNDTEWSQIFPENRLSSSLSKKDITNYYFERNNIKKQDYVFFEVLAILRLITVALLINKNNINYSDIDFKINIAINRCKQIIGAN